MTDKPSDEAMHAMMGTVEELCFVIFDAIHKKLPPGEATSPVIVLAALTASIVDFISAAPHEYQPELYRVTREGLEKWYLNSLMSKPDDAPKRTHS